MGASITRVKRNGLTKEKDHVTIYLTIRLNVKRKKGWICPYNIH